ncbi:MAG TPA: clostripain-related cysteine peptidase [Anaerolineales bacterium]
MKKLISIADWFASKSSPLKLAPAEIDTGRMSASQPPPWRSVWLSSDDREEVDVTRRRSGEGGDRERAQAPAGRQREDAPSDSRGGLGGFTPPSSGGGYSGSSGRNQLPIGDILAFIFRLPMPIRIVVLVVGVCAVGAYLFLGQPSAAPPSDQSFAPPIATFAPLANSAATLRPALPAATRPAVAPVVSPNGQTWLIMLYQDAKDQGLDQDIFTDLNEAERTGSTDRVRIVAQIDRARNASNARSWSSAKRFYLTRDADLHTVHSQQLADVGQVNMADPNTLIDFATWAISTYPSDHYVLIMSDHGMGWPGGWSDPAVQTSSSSDRRIPLAASIGNLMFLNDIDKALGTIRSQMGIDKFELIGMDACLMSQLEVLDALAPHGRYAVVSEETEPALGWAYTGFLDTLTANPNMTGADLAKSVVNTYIVDDQRIVDDQARAEFASRGSPLGSLFGLNSVPSADAVAQEMGADVTLTAIDLQAVPTLMNNVNSLAFNLQRTDSRAISQARSYAQSFTSIFGESVPPSYIDLGNWVDLLTRSTSDNAVVNAGQQVQAALQAAVLAEKHGPGKPGATGVSIYFPTAELYRTAEAGPESYTAIANRFASESLWDDFLAYFYTGRQFSQGAGSVAVPSRGATIKAPNAGGIQITPLQVSSTSVATRQSITLQANVDGQNVGYLKLFVGYYDRTANSINLIDEDYLQSSQTREASGVYYPVWPQSGKFTVKFNWEPIVFAIDDGQQRVPVLFSPETYGAAPADAVYTVDGTYTFADGSGSRRARLYFRDKILRRIVGFFGNDTAGAPRDIISKVGDKFTVLDQWIDLDQNGNPSARATQQGATLTFGDQPFRWKDLDAAAGDYVVGFVVEDLDGNPQQVFQHITVQ